AVEVRVRAGVEGGGQGRVAFAERWWGGLECLREPMAPRRALPGRGHPLGVGEEGTQGLPDKGIERLGRAVPSRTAVVMRRVEGLGRPATDLIAMPLLRRPRHTGGLAPPTTAQCPEEVGMGLVVPRGALLGACQLGLDALTILLAAQRRKGRDQGPRRGRGGLLTVGGFPQGRR